MTFKKKSHWRHKAAGYARWNLKKAKEIVIGRLADEEEASGRLLAIESKLAVHEGAEQPEELVRLLVTKNVKHIFQLPALMQLARETQAATEKPEALQAKAVAEANAAEEASRAAAAAAARRAQQLEADGIVEDWHRFELRCVLSHQRLADPAKGPACTHRACCNYQVLRDYVGRCASGPKQCPLAGCGARLQRTRDVERDDPTRALLERVPTDMEGVWVRGDEMRTTPPPGRGAGPSVTAAMGRSAARRRSGLAQLEV